MLVALRTGSGEAVQSIFPLVFVFLFLSSSSLPRELIESDWFRTVATYNPVSYIIEGLRAPLITAGTGRRWRWASPSPVSSSSCSWSARPWPCAPG